ncbi:hypothetical protein DY052_06255 [Apilactobacillus timberlakei]|uniref:DarT1-associated NADAR antitoxin family protein n=1 Tax=Apilactobacillus timberlakei TaxID=2008380 RepID=UPI00112DCA8A|nr:hypothetical protein [Apilactobacillus timberlakei]TPR15026.1 hypothetical protein DY052_06255 [Apilactobacillus timberlakei]
MAIRDVFIVNKSNDFVGEQVKFDWYKSANKYQRKLMSVKNLHQAFYKYNDDVKMLEVSSASSEEIGKEASALNLAIKTSHGYFTVEQLFQASKNYSVSGNHEELLNSKTGLEIKKSVRSCSKNEKLISFKLFGREYPLHPQTIFYNWLYCNALWQNPELAMKIVKYDAFTDINFNSQYGINSQAQACSIFTSLCRKLQLSCALKSFNDFRKVVYE